MGKTWINYRITVLHTRPHEFPANIKFLKIYDIKSTNTLEELQKFFSTAFKKEHPDWPIKEVKVIEE